MFKKSRKLLLKALKTRYKADMEQAVANLSEYLDNPAGIGDHPQIVAEMDILVGQYENASGRLESLKKMENEV